MKQTLFTELNNAQCQELRGGNWKNDIQLVPVGSPTTTWYTENAVESDKGNRWTVEYETTQTYSQYIVNPGGQQYQDLGSTTEVVASGSTTLNNGQFKKIAG